MSCGIEFLGTIFLLYVVLLTSNAWAIGLAFAIVLYVANGQYNPAITIVMYAKNKLSLENTVMNIIAQVLGGLGALGLHALI